ncbi:phage terminase small subunit P27 family [Gordonia sp. WA4-43]|uniref:phage terminase small subunit P27 family n=1 Tax=Gordonia sp. WA4-43 TaxID=2878678 RepID=UPI001CFB7C8C|nr:phage terminase small subunit P27 family [Gordonia sp. WA4-43]UCZ89055.1 phage terminase small subunit P27 family [Gordonia sp. WA4-43]
MPGPAAAPASLRLVGGRAPGRDSGGRKVEEPPPFARRTPQPPPWLSSEAAQEWARVVPELTRLDLLKESDRAALTAYCETWATWVDAMRDVRANGFTVENSSIRKDGSESTWVTKNPAVAVMETAATHLRQYAQEFGLTPSAESKLVGLADRGSSDDGDDPFE